MHVVTRSHRAVGDTKWETKWETKPDPCRDKISHSSERHSRRHSGRKSGRQRGNQSQIHVVTRSNRAVGDKVEDKDRSMS